MTNFNFTNKIFIIFVLLLLFVIYKLYNKQENFSGSLTPQSQTSLTNIPVVFNNLDGTTSLNNLNVTNDFYFTSFTGIIVPWSGAITNIPPGWGLCDGTTYKDLNGNPIISPDLRSKFILGASKKDTTLNGLTARQVNTQGGEEKHKLTIEEMPPHTHTYGLIETWHAPDYVNGPIASGNGLIYIPNPSGETGKSIPHNNMPPFYALAYIIKL